MSDQYSRVYRYIKQDPKFKHIYHQDKEALGWWLTLLLDADSMWPEPASLPYGIKETVLAKLTQNDIVIVDSDTYTYRIKGLDRERKARSKQASEAARSRWDSDRIQQSDAPAMRPHGDSIQQSDAEPMPRRERERERDEHLRAREGLSNITDAVQQAGEDITGHGILSAGDKQLTELDRLVEDHGSDAVVSAMRSVAAGKRKSWRQLVWDSVKVLEPLGSSEDVKAAEDDQQEKRRWEAARRHIASLRAPA